MLEVPNLTGSYIGDAEDTLSKLGLDHIVRTLEDDSVEADRVIKTDPPGRVSRWSRAVRWCCMSAVPRPVLP